MNLTTKNILSRNIPGSLLQQLYRLHTIRAIWLNTIGIVYVPTPKVVNRSIKEVLAKKVGFSGRISAHKYNWQYIGLKTVAEGNNFSFSFVRNPLDRLVSCYVQKVEMNDINRNFWKYGNKVKQNMSFQEFAEFVCKTPDAVSDRHFRSQHQFLCINDKPIVDFVGRFENLQQDWAIISKKLDLEELTHANKSNRKEITSYFTKELALKVANRYKKDIEIFNYQTEVDQLISKLS